MKPSQAPGAQRRALNTYVKLMRAANRSSNNICRHLQEDNLTTSQFAILEALHHLGPLYQGELGQKILKSNANITTVVDSLEKKQLVSRDRSTADRRRVRINLTPTGAELIARIFPHHAEMVEQEFSSLSADEQVLLGKLLKKLGQAG